MAKISNLDIIADLIHTTPSELIQCALQITQLPEHPALSGWLEEKLSISHNDRGLHFYRNYGTDLDVWLRDTLSVLAGSNPNSTEAAFARACGDSFEEYTCHPLRHEIVLHPIYLDVSVAPHIDFLTQPEPLPEPLRTLVQHEVWHADEKTLRKRA